MYFKAKGREPSEEWAVWKVSRSVWDMDGLWDLGLRVSPALRKEY